VALFAGVPRTATLQAKTSVRLLEFNIEKLRECFKEIPSLESNVISFYEFRLFLNVAMRHPLFSHFSERELESIWDYLLPINLGKNQMLIEEGKKGNSFYLISQGYLEVSRPDHGDEIYRLGPGQFIGEDSLLHDRPSSYKVRTETDCLLLECERETFTELCKRFPKLKQVIEEVAAVRYPERFHTDKILVD